MRDGAWSRYREALFAKQAELEGQLRKLDSIAIEHASDELDEVQSAHERELAVSSLERNTMLLAQVRSALDRIEDGAFGVCLECDEEINPKRLAALPWAAHCLACQEALDHERRPQARRLSAYWPDAA